MRDTHADMDALRIITVLNGIVHKKGKRAVTGYDLRSLLCAAHAADIRLFVQFHDDSGLITKLETGAWNEKVYT